MLYGGPHWIENILMVAAVTAEAAEAAEATAVRRSVSIIPRSEARAIIWIWC